MKIAVMGAGAVGCYYGARLFQAGHEVVLIGRDALVDAVRTHGLHLQMDGFDGFLPLQASRDAEAVGDADVLLFCVKSGDTETAGRQIAPFLADGCTVLSLQNGVDNAERLSTVLAGQPVLPAVVYVAAEMAGAGHVRHHGRGELVIGPSPAGTFLAEAFSAAGVPTRVSAHVADALWTKLVINCAYNALSALTQLAYGELVRGEGVLAAMRDVVAECQAVAAASGIALPATMWDDVLAISRSMAGQRSSTAQDVARGKPSEIDYINGHIVRTGEVLGIPVPANRLLHALVKLRDRAVV